MNDITRYEDGGAVANLAESTSSLAVQLAQVEIDSAVSTAKKFPRSLTSVQRNITELVMLDAETAEECVYALPRAGKPIKGPSIRFAEIVVSQYGNCHVGSRVVDVNRFEKYVEAEGVFIDLQSGMKRTARNRRRIVDRSGRLYNDDMIIVTGNAACSIALREAILKGVPKALWRAAYDAAETIIAGDVKTLSVRRSEALKVFANFGVTPDQIFASLDVEGADDIGLDQIATLTVMFKAIRDGDQQLEDYFPAKANAGKAVEGAKGTAAKLAALAADGATDAGKASAKTAKADKAALAADDAGKKAAGAADVAADGAAAASDGAAQAEGADGAAKGADDAAAADARDAGDHARANGRKLSACPPDIRGNPALHDAWIAGWEQADERFKSEQAGD